MPRSAGDGKGKTGGRQKGTPNKATASQREMMAKFNEETYDDFVDSYHMIKDPYKRCQVWLAAQAFTLPKLNQVTLKDKVPVRTYQDDLNDLSQEG